MNGIPHNIPSVFACSGCSNAGQLSDGVARQLDRRGVAEMSCLPGVGAAKAHFLKKLAEREVWVIDGCPIECSLGVFSVLNEPVDIHIRLHDLGAPLLADADLDALIDALMLRVAEQKSSVEMSPPPAGIECQSH